MELITNLLANMLPFIIVLTIVVFVHEFGHYFVAKKCGVKIEVFSIGFGKELFGFTDKYGTRWKFCLFPLGGYVKMYGDKNAASQSDDSFFDNLSPKERELTFQNKSLLQKSAIVAAGPIANYILAILIFIGFYWSFGYPNTKPIINKFSENSSALEAGLKQGDLIIEINNSKITEFTDIARVMDLNTGEKLEVKVKRDNEIISKIIQPREMVIKDMLNKEIKIFRLGIMADQQKNEKQTLISSIKLGFNEAFRLSSMSLKGLSQIITGNRSIKEMGGPIKIAQYSSKTAEFGIVALISFIALISLNLGLMNLLPIPVLDGGHLIIYAIEFCFGKKIAGKFQDFGFQIGIFLLIIISMIVTYNDLISLDYFSKQGLK